MKLRQHVYFSLWSDSLSPAELSARIGITPDRFWVRGSRVAGPPPLPRHHTWEIRCDERHLKLDVQIESVISRVAPARDAIRELIAEHEDITGTLRAGRHFGDEDGDGPIFTRREDGEIIDGGSLFGWGVSVEAVQFLAYVGAGLDIDEYDMRDDEDDGLP